MVAKLERKELKDAFPERDFSNWIRENLDEVNEATELSLSNATRERAAGEFRVDLIAEDRDGGIVVIENQLGTSNHDHLGKLLTYLAAFQAKAAIWVVEEPRVEHVEAIAWLNQSSSAAFYMIKVQAVKIGNSDFAPLLTLIVGPSEESKEIKEEKEEIVQRYVDRQNFWKGLLAVANKKTQLHANRSPTNDNWLSAGSGKSGIHFNYVIREHDVEVSVWVERVDVFDKFLESKKDIEQKFGQPLEWRRLAKSNRIEAISEIGGYRDPEKWPEIFEWMTDRMVALERSLRPYIDGLRI